VPERESVELILGTAQLHGTYGAIGRPAMPRGDDEGVAFLRHAVELGFSAIDTAPAYDDAEEIIGRAAMTTPVHTKVDDRLDPAQSVARSLTRLDRDHLDILYFHDSQIALHDPRERVRAAHELVGGPVVRLGASIYELDELVAAVQDGRFQVVQAPMNVLDRRIDDTQLRLTADAGVQIIARSVFLQGTILAASGELPAHLRDLAPFVDTVRDVARDASVSVATLALGWVKARPGIAGVIVGAQSALELQELWAAWNQPPIGPEVLEACGALATPPVHLCDPRQW
jgi:aryl-alcohol dehydrogenase-like predicted oxidoreductase